MPTGYQPPQNYGGPPPGNGYGGGQAPYGGQQVSSPALESCLADTGSHRSCLLQTETELKTERRNRLFHVPLMQELLRCFSESQTSETKAEILHVGTHLCCMFQHTTSVCRVGGVPRLKAIGGLLHRLATGEDPHQTIGGTMDRLLGSTAHHLGSGEDRPKVIPI